MSSAGGFGTCKESRGAAFCLSLVSKALWAGCRWAGLGGPEAHCMAVIAQCFL